MASLGCQVKWGVLALVLFIYARAGINHAPHKVRIAVLSGQNVQVCVSICVCASLLPVILLAPEEGTGRFVETISSQLRSCKTVTSQKCTGMWRVTVVKIRSLKGQEREVQG